MNPLATWAAGRVWVAVPCPRQRDLGPGLVLSHVQSVFRDRPNQAADPP